MGFRKHSPMLYLLLTLTLLAAPADAQLAPTGMFGSEIDIAPRFTEPVVYPSIFPAAVQQDLRDFSGLHDLSPSGQPAGEPIDLRIARQFRRDNIQANRLFRYTAEVTGFAAFPGTILLSGAFIAAGKIQDRPRLYDAGIHSAEALVLTAGAALAGKVALGRARPFESPEDPLDFRFGRGIEGDRYQSMPSFHTAAAFATGTVFIHEAASEGTDAAAWLAPGVFSVAVLSGISRMYKEQHWATDVIAGAVVGTLTGVTVNRYLKN